MAITKLSQLDLEGTYTYSDYLSRHLQGRLELLPGKIAQISPVPNTFHQKIVTRMSTSIGYHLLHHRCQTFVAPFDVRLAKVGNTHDEPVYTVVQPDICVVCDESKLDEKGCQGAPDLAVEVLSPGNTHREMRD